MEGLSAGYISNAHILSPNSANWVTWVVGFVGIIGITAIVYSEVAIHPKRKEDLW